MSLGGGTNGEAQARPRRGRRLAVVAATIVVAASLVAWPVVADAARGQVLILSDANALVCRSGEVTFQSSTTGAGVDLAFPSVAASPKLDCTYRFSIVNRGRRTVDVERLEFEVLGEDQASPLVATALDGARPIRPDVDAMFDVNGALEGGSSRTFTLRLRWNPHGCNSPGSGAFYPRAPRATVRSLGLREVVTPLGPTFGALVHESHDCNRP